MLIRESFRDEIMNARAISPNPQIARTVIIDAINSVVFQQATGLLRIQYMPHFPPVPVHLVDAFPVEADQQGGVRIFKAMPFVAKSISLVGLNKGSKREVRRTGVVSLWWKGRICTRP